MRPFGSARTRRRSRSCKAARNQLSEHDVLEDLRLHGNVKVVADVALPVFERNGQISLVPKVDRSNWRGATIKCGSAREMRASNSDPGPPNEFNTPTPVAIIDSSRDNRLQSR